MAQKRQMSDTPMTKNRRILDIPLSRGRSSEGTRKRHRYQHHLSELGAKTARRSIDAPTHCPRAPVRTLYEADSSATLQTTA